MDRSIRNVNLGRKNSRASVSMTSTTIAICENKKKKKTKNSKKKINKQSCYCSLCIPCISVLRVLRHRNGKNRCAAGHVDTRDDTGRKTQKSYRSDEMPICGNTRNLQDYYILARLLYRLGYICFILVYILCICV